MFETKGGQKKHSESETERLDRIAREAGFASYADFEVGERQLSQLIMALGKGTGEVISEELQPNFWNELL